MPIGNNISQFIQARYKKIRQLTCNMGISYTAAFEFYHAKTSAISLELLDKLSQYFQVTPNEIFPLANYYLSCCNLMIKVRSSRSADYSRPKW